MAVPLQDRRGVLPREDVAELGGLKAGYGTDRTGAEAPSDSERSLWIRERLYSGVRLPEGAPGGHLLRVGDRVTHTTDPEKTCVGIVVEITADETFVTWPAFKDDIPTGEYYPVERHAPEYLVLVDNGLETMLRVSFEG